MNKNYFTGFGNMVDSTAFEAFIDALPHGSGVDYDWSGHMPANGRYVYFSNGYHVMNDYGMYVGRQDFSIVLSADIFSAMIECLDQAMRWQYEPAKDQAMNKAKVLAAVLSDNFTLQFNNGRYLADYYMLRDHLEDTIAYALQEVGN